MLKKIFKALGIIIGIILILLIVLIIMSIDNKDINNPKVVEDNKTAETVLNNKLYEKTKDVKTQNDANITFNEEELEYLLYPIFMDMNKELSGFNFTGVNIDVENGEYFVKLSASAFGFYKTVVYAKIDFSFDNKTFAIKFNSVKLGNLGLTGVGKVALSMMNEKQLESDLEDSGIYVDINKKDLSIKMTLEDIEKTLTKQMDQGNKELVSLLFDIFLASNDLLELNLGKDNLLGAIVHLGNAKYNEALHGELKYNYDFSDIRNKCETLLENKKIDETTLSPIFNFLVKGYDHITDEEKAIVDKTDLSTIGINNKKLYEGVINRSDLSMDSYFDSLFVGKTPLQVMSILGDGFKIPDDTLTGILQSLDFIGYSYAFCNEEGKVGYFVLEQLDFTCLKEKLKIDLVGNINGLKIVVEANFDCLDENANGLTITGDVKKLLIGSYDLSDTQKTKLLKFLKDTLKKTNWISVDPDKEELVLDFSSAMSSAISKNATLSSIISSQMNETCNTYIREGYISIRYSIG